MEYWSWWIGAIALGGFVVVYGVLVGKPLGVSGSWMRVANWRSDKDLKEAETFFDNKEEAVDDLMAATMAEFGEGIVDELDDMPESEVESSPATTEKKSGYTPAAAHLVFLITMLLGSVIASLLHGKGFNLQFELSDIHSQIFGSGWQVWVSLFVGGTMVGFGTQMAGGCTSGHGLSGCAQFIPASLMATFVFFSSAVVLSVFMKITS